MLKIKQQQIYIVEESLSKKQAIEKAGQKLVENNMIEAEYIKGMLNREEQMSTYLGNHIAIPHGTPETKDFVKETGVIVLYFTTPVKWNDEDSVKLLVGIAAKGMEHIDILKSLTHALLDEDLESKLSKVITETDILGILTSGEVNQTESEQPEDNYKEKTFLISNEHGLHTRPYSELVKLAKTFDNEIMLKNSSTESNMVNAKSMMKVLSLGVKKGHNIQVRVSGDNAEQVLLDFEKAIHSGLGE